MKFKIKNDQLLVNLKNGGKSIPLISLTKDYWPDILSENIDIYSEIAEKLYISAKISQMVKAFYRYKIIK